MCVPVFVCASDWEGECESEREGREIRALLIENANLIETEKTLKSFFSSFKTKKLFQAFDRKFLKAEHFLF